MKQRSFRRWIEVREGSELPQIVRTVVIALRTCGFSRMVDTYRRDGKLSIRLRGKNGRGQDCWEARGTYSPDGNILSLRYRPWASSRWKFLIGTDPAPAMPAPRPSMNGLVAAI